MPVSLLLWSVATILLGITCIRLLLRAMGYHFDSVAWLEAVALALAGFVLLALGSIIDRLTRIVFYLHEHGTITKDEPHLSSK
ncbi:MAG TPA: hypothetical protein VKB88_19190 [Bryobacteraceae bacterium]|nr:hypothetical protein [Bryobacteraceae bacterium]